MSVVKLFNLLLLMLNLVLILQPQSELLNRKNLQGNQVVEKLDSLIVLALLHLESCQSSGRLTEVFPSIKLCT